MRRAVSVAGVLAIVLGITGCREEVLTPSSRHQGLRGANLSTIYRNQSALVHVLFIAERDIPEDIGHGTGMSSAGTPDRLELKFQYQDDDRVFIRAQPVTILKAGTVEAGGRTFQLSQGNLFIAMVHPSGSVALTQLNRVIADPEATAESVLAVMKTMAPGNARLQALKVQ